MLGGACQRGQAAPEYLGLILLVGLVAASFAAINLGPGFAGAILDAFCRAVGADCASTPVAVAYGPALPLVDPQLIGPERDRLLDRDPQQRQIDFWNLTASELAWLELNDPEVYEAAQETRSWIEQRDLVDAAMAAELDDFVAYKHDSSHDPRMDYSDDGCSSPTGSEGFFFDFREACYRHDFGYRNSKRLGLFDERKERWISSSSTTCSPRAARMLHRAAQTVQVMAVRLLRGGDMAAASATSRATSGACLGRALPNGGEVVLRTLNRG